MRQPGAQREDRISSKGHHSRHFAKPLEGQFDRSIRLWSSHPCINGLMDFLSCARMGNPGIAFCRSQNNHQPSPPSSCENKHFQGDVVAKQSSYNWPLHHHVDGQAKRAAHDRSRPAACKLLALTYQTMTFCRPRAFGKGQTEGIGFSK